MVGIVLTRPRKITFEPLLFGSPRKHKQFSLTATVVGMIAQAAESAETSHGVIVECLIRSEGIHQANPPPVKTSKLAEHYGEPKDKRESYTLTDEASNKLNEVAKKLNTSRSEAIESAVRNGGLELAREYYLQMFS